MKTKSILPGFLNILIIPLLIFQNNVLQAQDYYMNFAGSGSSTTVTSVLVENMTQGTNLSLNGSDILHLVDVLSGIQTVSGNAGLKLNLAPNPCSDFTRLQFVLDHPGQTVITLYDACGRVLKQDQDYLGSGLQVYSITGIPRGFYCLSVRSGGLAAAQSLISNGSSYGNLQFVHQSTIVNSRTEMESKKPFAIVEMQYTNGDRLKLTGISAGGIAVTTDITTADTTIVFNFVSCIDGDQNMYATIEIGTQLWMAENLKTTKYNDGYDIPLITDSATWAANRDPAYCWFHNDEATYKNRYGAIYTGYAAITGQLCPSGWHVPTFADWTTLQDYLITNGYNYDNTTSYNKIGKALASPYMVFFYTLPSSPETWDPDSGDGVVGNNDYPSKQNASGFSGIPAPIRLGDGSFGTSGHLANWWSFSENQNIPAMNWYWHLQYNMESFSQMFTYRWVGFSIRCLKD